MSGRNSVSELRRNADAGVPGRSILLGLLLFRVFVFLGVHALIAAGLSIAGNVNPWFTAGRWWMLAGTLANLLTLWLLLGLLRREGMPFRSVMNADADADADGVQESRDGNRRSAIAVSLLAIAVTVVAVFLFARLFLGGILSVKTILFSPIPAWAAIIGAVGFPLTTAAVELPFYYGYIMPRLVARDLPAGLAMGLCILFHAVQQVTLPFLPAMSFFFFHLLMLAPFALLVGASVALRPRFLPVIMVFQAVLYAWAGVTLLQQVF
jgi:hypothetical protein